MWKVEYTKKFLKELADLPQDMQARNACVICKHGNTQPGLVTDFHS
ncbi:hypothetical protein H6G36_18520 [Anabaena minutissima FACHB-250]|nr:hypothetical protein [Anabaena minutissima FACHB-250]